ncbi:hypothetical protein [Peribacillus frigoritolerans]|uniref:hypothetical protein n=1 Tax=Peribacillus frigoritolerans TaxID=450367 RepID=UPI00105A406C|nr:hypothetical protein [Peribacillus frigoritolerans]TDL78497.1 hypothetical protein E2R53_13565 [Peribacillus frigoritolerans]
MKTDSQKKTISVPLNIWLNVDNGHIHMNVGGKLTSVTNNPASKRGNPSLYGILEEQLRLAGKIK